MSPKKCRYEKSRFGSGPEELRGGGGGWRRSARVPDVKHSFKIGPVEVGAGGLFLIAGPCVIESEARARQANQGDAIQRIASDVGIPYIFKASYDKANRTSVKSFRGPGLKEDTAILGRLARDTGLPVLTDVHEPAHCEVAAAPDASTREAMMALLELKGVDVAMASAILACIFPERYIELDYQDLEALGQARQDVRFYEEYLEYCRRLASRGVVEPQGELPGPTPLPRSRAGHRASPKAIAFGCGPAVPVPVPARHSLDGRRRTGSARARRLAGSGYRRCIAR